MRADEWQIEIRISTEQIAHRLRRRNGGSRRERAFRIAGAVQHTLALTGEKQIVQTPLFDLLRIGCRRGGRHRWGGWRRGAIRFPARRG